MKIRTIIIDDNPFIISMLYDLLEEIDHVQVVATAPNDKKDRADNVKINFKIVFILILHNFKYKLIRYI